MKPANELKKILNDIDRKSYPAYKGTRGSYQFRNYILNIDHVQGDPFASPSKLSIRVDGHHAGFPAELYAQPYTRIALQDYLTRIFARKAEEYSFKAKGSGKSGLLSVSRCGQEVLERTACEISSDGSVLVRFSCGFPANGRTINSGQLIRILFDFLPDCVERTLFYRALDPVKVQNVQHLATDQQYIRDQLDDMGLVAFVANGSILPRSSGVSSRPMKGAVPFQSPLAYEVTLNLPHKGTITGMGIPKGITLIVGGGYHGKSTLLKALELGVYNHIAGDGREYVITDATALKIRAEDGRSIKKTDISMFVNNLPNKRDTRIFSTEDASGSTSQAANVIEGMESDTSLFLIDEDTCATNFMIRDELMQQVVHQDQEPITPFISRARYLFEEKGISSIIVAGSSGSYFHISDHIIQMDQYVPKDITAFAREAAQQFPRSAAPVPAATAPTFKRQPLPDRAITRNDRLKIKTLSWDTLQINRENIDLRYIEQLVDSEQTTALGYILVYAEKQLFNGSQDLTSIVARIRQMLDNEGLTAFVSGTSIPSMAVPRNQEIFACLNRYRGLNL